MGGRRREREAEMASHDGTPARVRWARLRFSIIGPLLAAPPDAGDLGVRLRELAAQSYRHPSTGKPVRFGVSTLERWYYLAREDADPVRALERKVPRHRAALPPAPWMEQATALRQPADAR